MWASGAQASPLGTDSRLIDRGGTMTFPTGWCLGVAVLLMTHSAASYTAPLLQSPLLLRSPRFSQQSALPNLRHAASSKGDRFGAGSGVEVATVLNLFGRGKDKAGKEGGVQENKYGVRFENMLDSVSGYGEAEVIPLLIAWASPRKFISQCISKTQGVFRGVEFSPRNESIDCHASVQPIDYHASLALRRSYPAILTIFGAEWTFAPIQTAMWGLHTAPVSPPPSPPPSTPPELGVLSKNQCDDS